MAPVSEPQKPPVDVDQICKEVCAEDKEPTAAEQLATISKIKKEMDGDGIIMWHKVIEAEEIKKLLAIEEKHSLQTAIKIVNCLGYPTMYPKWFTQQTLSMAFTSTNGVSHEVSVERNGESDIELTHIFNHKVLEQISRLPEISIFPIAVPVDVKNVHYSECAWDFMSKPNAQKTVTLFKGKKTYIEVGYGKQRVISRQCKGDPQETRMWIFANLLIKASKLYKQLYAIPLVKERMWNITFQHSA